MVWLTLILVWLAVGAGLGALLVWVMGRMILRPVRMGSGRALAILGRLTPEDLGLAYEPMDFHVRDAPTGERLRLAGWWMPAAARSSCTVVMLHGYADAKVGAIAWAPLWHELGWNILALDLRGHGESDGQIVTGGVRENADVAAVLADLRTRRPDQARTIILFGVSMGASIAARVAANDRDVAGVVLDSPYLDYQQAVLTHMQRNRLPLAWLHPLVMRWLSWRVGADFHELGLLRNLQQVTCPVLVLLPELDHYAPPADQTRIRDLAREMPLPGHLQVEVFEGAQHNLAYATDPERYTRIVREFARSTRPGDTPIAGQIPPPRLGAE